MAQCRSNKKNQLLQHIINGTVPEEAFEPDTEEEALLEKLANKAKEGGFGGGSVSVEVPIATTSTTGKVKPDGTTITVTSDGTISAQTADYAKISSRASTSDNAGALFLDDITSRNVVATIKKDGNSFTIEKESGANSSNFWYGFYIGINYETIEELDTYFNLNLLQNIDNGYHEVSDIRIVKTDDDWNPMNYPISIKSIIAKEGKFNIYDIIKSSDYFNNYSELNKLYIGIYYASEANSIEDAVQSKIKWNITPIMEIKNSCVIASDISERLKSELVKENTEELKQNINKIPIGLERVSIDNYSVRDIIPPGGVKNLVAISQKGKYINVKKESTQIGTKYCGVYIEFRYNKFEELDGNLLVEVKNNNGADTNESHILYGITDWDSGKGNIPFPINKKFNLKALLSKEGFNYNERNVLYFAVLRYHPNGVSDTMDFDIGVTFEPNNKEDVIATGITDSLMNTIMDTLNNSGIEPYITCWGDSLTAGGGWTTTLGNLLRLPVYNGGTGGESSKTIMARQGADVMMVNNLTIPADTTPITIASRSTDGGITTFFGNKVNPLLQGGAHVNPCYIGDIKGTLKWTGSNYSDMTGTWTFTREKIGEEVVINRPTAIRTDFDINKNSPQIMVIFMGQNGGYDNINHLIQQHRLMIEHSKCKDFIILGLSSGTESERLEYEKSMKNEFGRRFISLREYLSKYGLEDAGIEATEEDIEMMGTGKTPTSLLSDSVHYTSECKIVIGKMLAKKIKELGMI